MWVAQRRAVVCMEPDEEREMPVFCILGEDSEPHWAIVLETNKYKWWLTRPDQAVILHRAAAAAAQHRDI